MLRPPSLFFRYLVRDFYGDTIFLLLIETSHFELYSGFIYMPG